MLAMGARGVDGRRVEGPRPRKSVGSEVNWGVRLANEQVGAAAGSVRAAAILFLLYVSLTLRWVGSARHGLDSEL